MFVIVRVSKCQHPALPIHLDSSQFISLPRQPSALFRFSSPIFLRDLWKFVTTRNKPTIGSFRYPRVPLCSLHSKQNCYVFSLLFLPICPETRCMNFWFLPQSHRTNVSKTSLVQNLWTFSDDWCKLKIEKKKKNDTYDKIIEIQLFHSFWPSTFPSGFPLRFPSRFAIDWWNSIIAQWLIE